jgi:p-aminobenzoyl-glutamate transporter AbgT
MTASSWANLITVVHFLMVAWAVIALPVTLIGLATRAKFARGFWFRTTHLLFILFVVGETVLGVECPLTTWERDLRAIDGRELHEVDDEPWLARASHNAFLFRGKTIADMLPYYLVFGIALVLVFIVAPPRGPDWPSWPRRTEPLN